MTPLRAILVGVGAFTHRGVLVWCVGVLLDQQRAAAAIDAAVEALDRQGVRGDEVAAVLRRIVVRVMPEQAGARQTDARWAGGVFDRGKIRLRLGHKWEERLAAAVAALVLRELRPDVVLTMADGVVH